MKVITFTIIINAIHTTLVTFAREALIRNRGPPTDEST